MSLKTTPTIVATAVLLFGGYGGFTLTPFPPTISLASAELDASQVVVRQYPGAAELAELVLGLAEAKGAALVSAERAVRAAGASGDRSTVPALWDLADRFSEGQAQHVALEALDALWRLGEPAWEFEARLDLLHAKPNLARYVCLVLARSLRPEHVARIEAVARAAEGANLPRAHLFSYAASRGRMAAMVAGSYERASSLQARVDAVAPAAHGDCQPFLSVKCSMAGEFSLTTADPVRFIARSRLYELSNAEPAATVTALMASEMGVTPEVEPDEAKRKLMLDFYRDHAARHLAPAAKAIYESLRPQAFDW